ncbi:MAG: hypothetical protein ACREEU_09995 [Acetobacteraceae bacterium]
MLSLILYGRNDSYGYNLHKRAALSLNCMAELLDCEGDEILFVDYNTPDDYPTFPEAIRDTLTSRARRLLRIFRVRPSQHARFRQQTHLVALEPVARNVALRRSNSENRWILSTNTDMIFVPRDGCPLGGITGELDDALYHLPRFEVPETLWEGLDRMDPKGTISEIGRWGWDLHLNEIVFGSDTVLYDGPGDFQLAPRADLFRIDGFDERMLLGWHVDSNLARRLGFLHGPPRSLADHLFGYHCDHTRQVTPAHRHDRVENDWRRFVDGVSRGDIPEQSDCWGLASETIEETRLDGPAAGYVGALRAAIGEGMKKPTEIAYRGDSYEKVGYDPRHVLPFVVDALSCYPPATTIGWIGADAALLDRFVTAWERLGFSGSVLVPAEAPWLQITARRSWRPVPLAELVRSAAAFVIDFGPQPAAETTSSAAPPEPTQILRCVALSFRRLVTEERRRLEDKEALPRRFIAVNAVLSRFEGLVRAHIGAPLAPIGTRLRQGFVLPAENGFRSLLATLDVGGAGRREGSHVATLPGVEGYVLFGGYRDLMAGSYRLRVSFEGRDVPERFTTMDLMVLEVVTGSHYLAFRPITGADIAAGDVALEFAVADGLLHYLMALRAEFRLLTRGLMEARVTGATLEDLGAAPGGSAAAFEWLPLMFVGNAGRAPPGRSPRWQMKPWQVKPLRRAQHPPDEPIRATAAGVLALKGKKGFVVYGPYVTLLPGRHLLEIDLAPGPAYRRAGKIAPGSIRFDVFCLAGEEVLAKAEAGPGALAGASARIEFTVPDRPNSTGSPMRLEFRVWSSGEAGFMVRGVRTRPIALLPIGEAWAESDAVEPMRAAAAR